MSNQNNDNNEQYKLADYFRFGAMGGYVKRLFGKKDPNAPNSFNLRVMHGINKISILVFLFAVMVLVVRRIFF
jgi:hypothetical protein